MDDFNLESYGKSIRVLWRYSNFIKKTNIIANYRIFVIVKVQLATWKDWPLAQIIAFQY